VVTYDAVIDVDNSDLRLRPGMTANVTVVYAQKDGVLGIPNAALRFRPPSDLVAAPPKPAGGGKRSESETRTIWLLRGAQPEPLEVKPGLSDGTYTELADGDLKEGDPIVVDVTRTSTPAASTGAPPGGPANVRRMF
jgi:HlyD family secretion protein